MSPVAVSYITNECYGIIGVDGVLRVTGMGPGQGSQMPITITFDIETASVTDTNDRNRIYAAFERLGWENIGGSAWRYPALGSKNPSEDWFNHVIPAMMYFRSMVEHAGLNVTTFTVDAHSEAGFRGKQQPNIGAAIRPADRIEMYESGADKLSEERLRRFISDAANSLN